MPIHPQHGAHIYYEERGDATMLAYRKLHTEYLVFLFAGGQGWHALASFSQILDALPVESVPLSGVQLELHDTVEGTMEAWRVELYQKLVGRLTMRPGASAAQPEIAPEQETEAHPLQCLASRTPAA